METVSEPLEAALIGLLGTLAGIAGGIFTLRIKAQHTRAKLYAEANEAELTAEEKERRQIFAQHRTQLGQLEADNQRLRTERDGYRTERDQLYQRVLIQEAALRQAIVSAQWSEKRIGELNELLRAYKEELGQRQQRFSEAITGDISSPPPPQHSTTDEMDRAKILPTRKR